MLVVPTAGGRQEDSRKGREMSASPVSDLGSALSVRLCVVILLYTFSTVKFWMHVLSHLLM